MGDEDLLLLAGGGGQPMEHGNLFRCSCQPVEEECDAGKQYCETHTKVNE